MSFTHLLESLKIKTNELQLESIKKLYEEKIEQIKDDHDQKSTVNITTRTALTGEQRNKQKLEAEIEMLLSKVKKKEYKTNNSKTEQYNVAKKVFELEEKIGKLESILNEKQHLKQEIETEVNALSSPSMDSLFNSFMKGFGVDFVEENGKQYARIKNKEKTDTFMIELDNKNVEEIRETIWTLL